MGSHCAIPSTDVGSAIYASTVAHHKNSEYSNHAQFFIRVANSIKAFDDERKQKFLKGHW